MAKLIGTDPNQVPTNADLGTMAYQDYDALKALLLASGNRNLIINGAMQVAQRGTSFSHTGVHSTYTVDRWLHVTNGTSSTTAQTWTTINSEKVIALTSTSTSSTYNVLMQRLEGLRSLQGKEVTLSAYVKGEAGTFAQYMEFRNSGGSGVSSVNTNLYITTSWQKFTWTVTVPTNASFDNDSSWFNVSFYGGASLDIAQVQLEVGNTATPFEHRSYGDELARCQRYFYRLGNIQSYSTIASVTAIDGSSYCANIPLPVPFRASPSVSTSGGSVFSNESADFVPAFNIPSNSVKDGHLSMFFQNKGTPPTYAVVRGGRSGSISHIDFDAEL